jgi:hypothetical protein
LSEHSVPYCIVGGVAVALHGVPRMTYDVDLLVMPSADAYARADRALTGLGLRPRPGLELPALADLLTRRRLKDERNPLAVTYADPWDLLRQVDVLVDPDVDAEKLIDRSIFRPLGRATVRLCSRSDLIELKRRAGFTYTVTDEQLRTFSALTDEQKIAWLEEWQRATWEAATPGVRASWWRLRGKTVPDHPDFAQG